MRIAAAACLVAGLWACGGGGSQAGGQAGIREADRGKVCVEALGSYRVSYLAQNGTCGAVPDSITVLTSDGSIDGCKGTGTVSDNKCEYVADVTCATPDGGFKVAGNIDWTADASRGVGTFQITVLDTHGATRCTGLYEVTYTKN